MPILLLLLNTVLFYIVLAKEMEKEEIKGIQTEMEENQMAFVCQWPLD